MNLIAAVDSNWAIGKGGKLLVQIPMDQQFFREETMGKVVVMGRRTLESFPNSLPPDGRTCFVLSRNSDYKVRGAQVVHSIDELDEAIAPYDSGDVYIIGGGQVYSELLDRCDVAHITKINYSYDADTYFPNLDERPEWVVTGDSEEQTYFDIEFFFYRYERRK